MNNEEFEKTNCQGKMMMVMFCFAGVKPYYKTKELAVLLKENNQEVW